MQPYRAIAEPSQRLGRHHDAEIGTADADVHDVGEACALRTRDARLVHGGDELAHLREFGPHGRHDVLPAGDHRSIRAVAQRHVQRGAALGVVDRLAREQVGDALLETAGPGERDQQLEGPRRRALARAVVEQVQRLEGQMLVACPVLRKQRTDGNGADLGGVRLERLPLWQFVATGHGGPRGVGGRIVTDCARLARTCGDPVAGPEEDQPRP